MWESEYENQSLQTFQALPLHNKHKPLLLYKKSMQLEYLLSEYCSTTRTMDVHNAPQLNISVFILI